MIMLDDKTKKILRILNYVAFIPVFGFIIVCFYGFFLLDKKKKSCLPAFIFGTLSLVCLAFFVCIVYFAFYFFGFFDFLLGTETIDAVYIAAYSFMIIMFFVAYICGTLLSKAILKRMLERLCNERSQF